MTTKPTRAGDPSPTPSVNICAQAWHGSAGENFNFINPNTGQCTAKYTGDPNTWPFVGNADIVVPGQTTGPGGGPGQTAAQIKTGLANGNYSYTVDGCPRIGGGVPATLTIP